MSIKSDLDSAFQSQDLPGIERLLDIYLTEYKDDYDRFSYMCNYNLMIENYDDALTFAKEAVKLNPHCAESNFNLAYVYDLTGDYAHAYLYYSILKTLQTIRKISCIPEDTIDERLSYIKSLAVENSILSKSIVYADNYIQYSAHDPFHRNFDLIGVPISPDNNTYICGRYNDLMNQFFIKIPPKDAYRCKAELLKTTEEINTSLVVDENCPCILPLFILSGKEQTITFEI